MPFTKETREAPDQADHPCSPPAEAFDSLAIVVGEIAHDFNNVLSLIFGYVEMALSELPEGSRARSDLEHVLAAGERAKELVARILTYSNQARLKRSHIGLAGPVREALDRLAADLPGNVRMNREIAESGNRVVSNPAEIYQIVLNLCCNSLQAMPKEGGEVTVTLDYFDQDSEFWRQHEGLKQGTYAHIRVHDTGVGMELGTQEKMYHPFFTTARGQPGESGRAGLGLTTVYNIVASHNGMIFVHSLPGRGSCFDICLPVASSGHLPEAPPPSAALGRRILLVDDESSALLLARGVLEAKGCSVISFSDTGAALDYLRASPETVDLLVTDLLMPGMAGTDLAQEAIRLKPGLPVVLFNSAGARISGTAFRHWGIRQVVTKPWTPGELFEAIEKALNAARD